MHAYYICIYVCVAKTWGQFHKTLKLILKSKSTSTIQALGFHLVLEIKRDTVFLVTKKLISIWSSKTTINILTWLGLKFILILKLILKFYDICPWSIQWMCIVQMCYGITSMHSQSGIKLKIMKVTTQVCKPDTQLEEDYFWHAFSPELNKTQMHISPG